MPLTKKQLSERLSKRLANFKLSDAIITRLADRFTIEGLDIKKFDPCIYGICIDYFGAKLPKLDGLLRQNDISKWEVFPYGIIDWDHFHVRVAYNVDEIVGR